METTDLMVQALRLLCKEQGGHELVAENAGVSAANLDQIIKGVKLPSGRPRGVGPGLRAKLTAAYPQWLDVKERSSQSIDMDRRLTSIQALLMAMPESSREKAYLDVVQLLIQHLPANQPPTSETQATPGP